MTATDERLRIQEPPGEHADFCAPPYSGVGAPKLIKNRHAAVTFRKMPKDSAKMLGAAVDFHGRGLRCSTCPCCKSVHMQRKRAPVSLLTAQHGLAALLAGAITVSVHGCDGTDSGPSDQGGLPTSDGAVPFAGSHEADASSAPTDASLVSLQDGGAAPRDGGQGAFPNDAGRADAALGMVPDGGGATIVGAADAGASADAGNPLDAGGAPTTCVPPAPGSKGKNPLFTDQFTADPGAFVHHCTFYIQCGHDEAAARQNGFVMKEWFLLSSTDMVNWTKSVALRLSDFSWADANAWAGQMVEKNGKFYWYVPVNERGGGMSIGVAVADSPTGPFKDALGKPLINDKSEMSNFGFTDPGQTVYTIDPTVFVDDDGQAYLHYGGFSRMVVAKLNADMTSIQGKMQEVTPRGFFEAPYLFKRNGKYYEVYAAGVNPATIDYATSNSPMGPWTRGGRILDALPNVAGQDAATNHAGIAQLGGQWYMVYHLSNGPNGGGTYRREVAIDKLTFNTDGSIQKITPSAGLSF
jgi:hypothetical protein